MGPLLLNQWGGFSPDSKTKGVAVEGRQVSILDFGLQLNKKNSVISVASVAKKFALWQEGGGVYDDSC